MTVIERPIEAKVERAIKLDESVELQAIGLVQAIVAKLEQDECLLERIDDSKDEKVELSVESVSIGNIEGQQVDGIDENNLVATEPTSDTITEVTIPVEEPITRVEKIYPNEVTATDPISDQDQQTVEEKFIESPAHLIDSIKSGVASVEIITNDELTVEQKSNAIKDILSNEPTAEIGTEVSSVDVLTEKIQDPALHAEVSTETVVSQNDDSNLSEDKNVINLESERIAPTDIVEIIKEVVETKSAIDENYPKTSVEYPEPLITFNEVIPTKSVSAANDCNSIYAESVQTENDKDIQDKIADVDSKPLEADKIETIPLYQSPVKVVDITSEADGTAILPLSVDVSSAVISNSNDQQISEKTSIILDDLVIISKPESDEYVCKVEPTEYDITVAEANQNISNATSQADVALIGQIMPDDSLVEDITIPRAILISTKPALVALDLANGTELLSTDVPEETCDDTQEAIKEVIVSTTPSQTLDVASTDSLTIPPQNESAVSFISETSIANVMTANDVNTSNAVQSTVDMLTESISVTDDTITVIISEEVAATSDTVSQTESISLVTQPESIKIPVVIVTESSEQTIENQPPKTLIKQSSLEIPIIDSRDNFEDLMKPQTAVSASVLQPKSIESDPLHDTDDDSEFVIVSDAEVEALKFEEESRKTIPSTESVPDAAEASPIAHVIDVDIQAQCTDTLSNTTNITDTTTTTKSTSSVPLTVNTLITPNVSDVEIRKPEGQFIGIFKNTITFKVRYFLIRTVTSLRRLDCRT